MGYCSLSIKAGTRNEDGFSSGIAHFCEHTIFKGTSRKSAAVVNSRLEKLGGELNAFTTKEEIVLHATTLKADVAKAASLLLELAFDARFPEDEIEVEKGVVIDEIASYKDAPSEDIYDSFEERLFAGSPLSRPILGTQESVQGITSEELRRFRSTFFTPERMVLTMVSPLSEDKMASIVEKCISRACERYSVQGAGSAEASCSGSPAAVAAAECLTASGPALCPVAVPFCVTEDKDDNQVNCIIGAPAPRQDCEQERLATILLCNILGGPASNSVLGAVLREKHGWVYNVECGYTPYSDCGIATIQFGCEKENLQRCLRVVRAQLRRFIEKPMAEWRLNAAKRQMLAQNAIGLENGETQCISMGKSLLSYGVILSDGEVRRKVMAIPASLVQRMACEIFSPDKVSTLIYL